MRDFPDTTTQLTSRDACFAARRALLCLAIVATLVGDLALAASPAQFPEWPALALLGLALGQVTVAAAWLALGSSPWSARCAALPLVAMSLAHLLAPKFRPSAAELLGVLLAVGAAVGALLFAARLSGLRVVAGAARANAVNSVLASQRYSLASLFALTTVVAIYAALVRETSFPAEQRLTAVIHCIGFFVAAILPLAMFAAAGGDWRLWLLGAVVLGAVWGAAAGPIGRVAAIEAAFLGAVASLLLECDYHIHRSGVVRAGTPSDR
jgi:hypothetical protein